MMQLLPLFSFAVEVGPVVDLGNLGARQRRMVPITGGTVSGEHRGVILPGGADFQEVGPDKVLEIDARYVLSLQEGLVEVHSKGLRHGPPEILARLDRGDSVDRSDYYFRTVMRFRATAQPLLYLNTLLAISQGERQARTVNLQVFRLT